MRAIRRILQVVALVGTLIVGILAVALIVSQTPWFHDWLRRYIVRESRQYMNGDLAIGGLTGNLFFGVDLTNVTVDVSGQRVVAAREIFVDYSILEIVSKGIVIKELRLDEPVLRLERDATGWNLAHLVKRQQQEANRQGPMRPISFPLIQVAGGSVSIDDKTKNPTVKLPRQIDNLDVKAAFEYAPVHYTVTLDHLSFRGVSPEITLNDLTGTIAVRDDNLYLDGVQVRTSETSLAVDGVIEKYLSTQSYKLASKGTLSMPELGRFVPVAAGYPLHPVLDVKTDGPLDRMGLILDVKTEAGNAKGAVTADFRAPDIAFKGDVDVVRLNLAPIIKDPTQRTDITGHAKVDVQMKSEPAGSRAPDRFYGSFAFNGPHVAALGYEGRNVKATGTLKGARITLDASAAAYGGTATARGFIVPPAPGRALSFDLAGHADHVDLRGLPASTGAPKMATNLSVAVYHVSGEGTTIQGKATLNQSTVEGATIGAGTIAEFGLTPSTITYAAHGDVADLNIQRIGDALNLEALAKPAYDSRINGSFDVNGSQPRTTARAGRGVPAPSALANVTLDAKGTFRGSDLMGGRLPELAFETHLDHGTLTGRADGAFEGFNPAQITGRKELDGQITGTVNANFAVNNIDAPITPDAVTADGKATLTKSTVGGLQIDSADVEGKYAAQVGDITKVNVTGPDIKVDASGRLALDRTTQSNLKYHVEAIDLPELAKLAGQTDVGGSAILDGTLTGNAASLQTAGTIDGSNLAYGTTKALDLNSKYAVTVPELDFAKAHVQATTNATFVAVGSLQLNAVTAATTYDQQRIDFQTNIKEKTRELDASGQVILHPDHQEIHLPNLALRTQGVEWRTAPGSAAAVEYGHDQIQLKDVKLVSGDQALDVTGTISTAAAGATSGAINVHARNVDLQQLQMLMLQDRGFSGKLNADATISGSTSAPKIDGTVQVNNGAFQTYHYDSLTAKVDYSGTRIGLDATLQQSPTEAITAKGSVPTSLFEPSTATGHVEPAPGEAIDLQIKSNALNLAVVQGLTSQVTNVTGTLQADVHVTGSGQDPHLNGFIDIKNGGFGLPLAGGTFTGLTTRLDFEQDRMRIQKFELLDHNKERLTVSGELAVHERSVGAVNISIDSDNFEIVHNELGDLQVQSALKVTGDVRHPRVVGEVRLDAARVEVDQVLELFYNPYAVEALPDVVSAETTVRGSGSAEEATKDALDKAQQSAAAPGAKVAETPQPASGTIADAIALDVHVVVPDNLVLRGKDLRPGGPNGTALGNINITVGGDVRVTKEPGGKVAPIGTVNTVRGTYEFQGRRFDLVRGGTVRFIGTPTINPILDVTATRQIPNTGVEARVHITGTVQAPELALSSNPPLEESDILALIVFNRPVNELGTGERSSLAATAGGIATGFLAAPLGESIGKALDLDLFEITTTTETGDLGAGVTLGQQLGDRAFIKLRQEFGARNVTEFELDYQLARFLRLETKASPETSGSANRINQRRVERAGIDLIFFFSY